MTRTIPPRVAHRAVACALGVAAALAVAPLHAEITQSGASGFVSNHAEAVQASPDAVWQAILRLPAWWSDAHTYSGKAANLVLEPRAGGCWCESWDGGSVQHARVVLVMPGRLLRLHGGLGPLQDLPVEGVLNIATGVRDGRTQLRMHYRVGGPAELALDKLSAPVDGVMGTQFKRLKALIETGKPD
mgnify:CR=1 FL=1